MVLCHSVRQSNSVRLRQSNFLLKFFGNSLESSMVCYEAPTKSIQNMPLCKEQFGQSPNPQNHLVLIFWLVKFLQSICRVAKTLTFGILSITIYWYVDYYWYINILIFWMDYIYFDTYINIDKLNIKEPGLSPNGFCTSSSRTCVS